MNLLIKKLLSYLPSRLPVGMTQFQQWSQDIIDLCGPLADEDSMRFAICSQILHMGAQKDRVPKRYFVASLRKAAANQVASQVFQDVKLRQQEKAQEAAAALATAAQETSSGSEQSK